MLHFAHYMLGGIILKKLHFILGIIVFMIGLVACGNTAENDSLEANATNEMDNEAEVNDGNNASNFNNNNDDMNNEEEDSDYVQLESAANEVFADDEHLYLIVTGVEYHGDSEFEFYQINMEIENKADEQLKLVVEDMFMDEEEVDELSIIDNLNIDQDREGEIDFIIKASLRQDEDPLPVLEETLRFTFLLSDGDQSEDYATYDVEIPIDF